MSSKKEKFKEEKFKLKRVFRLWQEKDFSFKLSKLSWWTQLLKVGGLIALSKLSGFFRDLLAGAFLGTSFSADAFNTAVLFTNNLFIIFGGLNGPFHSATVSALSEIPPKRQGAFLNKILLICLGVFILLGTLGYFLLGFVFSSREDLEVLSQLRAMLPVFFLAGVIGILFGASATHNRLVLPGISHLFSNLSVIFLSLLFFHNLGALVFGVAFSVGAILQVSIISFDLIKHRILDFKINKINKISADKLLRKDFLKDLSCFRKILLPALFSSSSGSLNVYLDWFFCSELVQGSWSAILYGNRLIQLPFGVLVGASLLSFLPKISKHKDQPKIFQEILQKELKNLTLVLVPAAALLFSLSRPLVYLLFQRGAFDENSTLLVSSVLFALSLSLLTSLPREIYTRAFYALGDSQTPFLITLGSLFLNLLFNSLLVKNFAVMGIAFSTTLTALVNSLIFMFLLSKKQKNSALLINLETVFFSVINFLICFLVAKFSYEFLSVKVVISEKIPQLNVLFNLGLSTLIVFLSYFLVIRLEEKSTSKLLSVRTR